MRHTLPCRRLKRVSRTWQARRGYAWGQVPRKRRAASSELFRRLRATRACPPSISTVTWSPSSIRAIGPPAAASGLTWPTQGPFEAPEKRPSVRSATLLDRPMPNNGARGREHLTHARAALRTLVANNDHIAGLNFASEHHASASLFLAIEATSGAGMRAACWGRRRSSSRCRHQGRCFRGARAGRPPWRTDCHACGTPRRRRAWCSWQCNSGSGPMQVIALSSSRPSSLS